MLVGVIGLGRIGLMHAQNLLASPGATELLLADAVAETAQRAAARLRGGTPLHLDQLFDSAPEALVIAAATSAHRELIERAVSAGIPVFCEKPVAASSAEALELVAFTEANQGIVQIGHQRRFDAGYRAAKAELGSGKLGWLHSIRAVTADARPPALEFLAGSGGIFRDCSVHDFDIIRWLTGQDVVEVYARGSNRGDPGIGEAGDVDTGAALLTLTDGTLATVVATRYNGAGHDVRMELQGSAGSVCVGLDEQAALHSAEPGVAFPTGVPHPSFMERFAAAYRSQLDHFLALARGEAENPCPLAESAAASRVADAAQESLERGVAVRL
ncbi:Gfo/Idh/MocA family protein [Arthrobacter russicus]|jgi:myo-inositol 2-dehydrogenase/D-chiro-inositol 1-dehydrogenase|uniref:Myo-inositol 2-dehydrogenase/D-chiro-inositol 1-dehydrogenase n=1 Tax=Arthrobacter russicus TaxID=172040 RepID=A0ABU1JAX4_9MICC|nr:Gfo/Idh/MocA family oxidoreductase [Arthrobacter russicus]MDR6269572.1 myo-inositol 2-dehydrogenase/D-chiro-inositol 1-dehydrogenase [Arthrobacter russicus]